MWACVSNFAFFALLLLQFRISLSIDNDTDKSVISQLQIYKRLLRQKRIDHVDAAKSLADMDNYEKKYKMLKLIFDKIFLVFTEVQKSMEEDEWEAGKELPQDEKQRESLSKLFENTLFMGDLVLRIPDMSHRIYDRNDDWKGLMSWAYAICENADVFEKHDLQLLHLMGQELGLIPKEETYTNPYREKKTRSTVATKTVRKKKEKQRGPSMQGQRHEL